MGKRDHTENEILGLIEEEETKAYGINDADLAADRARALNYYHGEVDTVAPEGRSSVVSRDVLDVVEAAIPQLLKVFVSGDQVVKFEPRNLDDEEGAAQETDYINHVVMEKNNGFTLFYAWFKDALLSKNGYAKAYYEEEDEVETEQYQGLTDAQLAMVVNDDRVSVLEHTAYPDPNWNGNAAQLVQMGAPVLEQPMLHDIKIEVSERKGAIKICNVAPEDILVSTDCRTVSVQNCRFVQHRVMMTREDMVAQGWDVPDDLGYTDEHGHWEEVIARDLYNESQNEREEILVKDTYFRVNGKLGRYVIAGKVIVHQEDPEIVPFAVLTPHIMPHRHVGMSYADLCMDIQDVKTALVRGQLDNMYLMNNGRTAINANTVSIEDMLVSRPGGVVRVNGQPGADIMPLQHTPFPATSFSLVEYFDTMKEKRTGLTAYNQGLDANSLNKTASGITQIMGAAQQRIELVARTFAETGVKELFMLVHRLARKYYTKPDIIRLRDKWVEVDPRQWKTRTDMTITVGLGTGNKDQQLAHLMNILAAQKEALMIGVSTPKNIYNALTKLTQNAGFREPQEFWTDPGEGPMQPKQDPKIEVEKGRLMLDKERLEFDKMKALGDYQLKQAELGKPEGSESSVKLQSEAAKYVIEQAKLELDKYKAELDASTRLKIAGMSTMANAEEPDAEEGAEAEAPEPKLSDVIALVHQLAEQSMAPKTIEYGPDGRAVTAGGRQVIRGPDGRVIGLQ